MFQAAFELASSGFQTAALYGRSTKWAIEPTGIGSESYPI